MKFIRRNFGVIFASIGFLAMIAVFVYEGFSLYDSTVGYARRDLKARAELAALVLAEPLRTQDFKRIREFDEDCRAKKIHFTVHHRDGGVVYGEVSPGPGWGESQESGEYVVDLKISGADMFLPFVGALALAGIAFLVGIAGMIFVFFAFYRQRARLAEMARMERVRYEFVTEFTHELKTPLTGIIAAADMLEGSKLAEMIKSSARRLDQLAQDLIDVYWGRKSDDR